MKTIILVGSIDIARRAENGDEDISIRLVSSAPQGLRADMIIIDSSCFEEVRKLRRNEVHQLIYLWHGRLTRDGKLVDLAGLHNLM